MAAVSFPIDFQNIIDRLATKIKDNLLPETANSVYPDNIAVPVENGNFAAK